MRTVFNFKITGRALQIFFLNILACTVFEESLNMKKLQLLVDMGILNFYSAFIKGKDSIRQ